MKERCAWNSCLWAWHVGQQGVPYACASQAKTGPSLRYLWRRVSYNLHVVINYVKYSAYR